MPMLKKVSGGKSIKTATPNLKKSKKPANASAGGYAEDSEVDGFAGKPKNSAGSGGSKSGVMGRNAMGERGDAMRRKKQPSKMLESLNSAMTKAMRKK